MTDRDQEGGTLDRTYENTRSQQGAKFAWNSWATHINHVQVDGLRIEQVSSFVRRCISTARQEKKSKSKISPRLSSPSTAQPNPK